MKKWIILLAFGSIYQASAQQKDTVNVNAILDHATVYYGYGASLMHSVKVPVAAGLQQVLINNLALAPDANTIQIACPENVTILSYYHRIYSKPVVIIPNVAILRSNDTLKILQKQINAIANDYVINEDLLRRITGLIENNFTTDNKKQLSSAELIKLTDYYTERVKTIKIKMFELNLRRYDLTDQLGELNNRINTLTNAASIGQETTSTGQLVLQVIAQNAGVASFDVNYFTRDAGWVPAYDIRVKTIDNSFKLVYKASVQQTTGLNWKAVKLNLSTSNPNQGTLVPVLAPSFLQLYVPQLYNEVDKDIREDKVQELSSVVVTSMGVKRQAKELGYGTTKVSDFMTLKESQLNTNFEIALPYDIPCDGKIYKVTIKDENVAATYKHDAVPKLDNDAFLLAQLTRWDSLSLLPGEANIIMDNVYLGKSFIDPNTTMDTLSLSLGRDKRIALKRILVKEFTNTSIKGDNKTEIFTYELSVKNNKKQPVAISIKDQYPISQVKEVEVKLINDGGAMNNIETGILNWNVQLQPGESKKFRFTYSIKYPKDRKLQM